MHKLNAAFKPIGVGRNAIGNADTIPIIAPTNGKNGADS